MMMYLWTEQSVDLLALPVIYKEALLYGRVQQQQHVFLSAAATTAVLPGWRCAVGRKMAAYLAYFIILLLYCCCCLYSNRKPPRFFTRTCDVTEESDLERAWNIAIDHTCTNIQMCTLAVPLQVELFL